ncbi:hypothetical protein N2152v2_009828 [Parachlorella kessleri]
MEDRRERSSMLWRDYFLRQRQQRAGRDRLASAVVILILTVMAVRMQGKVNRGDMLHYAANVFLALISAFNSRSHTYMLWRNLLAVVLRLSVVTCDLVSKHAENMLQEDAPGLPTALVTSAVRILVGDHALLLAFLATGWPFMRQTTSMSGIEALRPAASLEPRSAWDAIAPALFARHNKVEVSPPAWPGVDHALLQHVRPPQVCMVYTTILQTIIGFVLPAFFFLCYDSSKRSNTYLSWRNLLAVALRLEVVTCALIAKHAEDVLQEHPPDSPRAFLTAALRLLVGDHALLLAFLATGWPVGSLSNIFVQFVSLLAIVRHNGEVCKTPFMWETTARSGLAELRPAAAGKPHYLWEYLLRPLKSKRNNLEVCMVYTFILQLLVGFVLPTYFFLCYDSRAAVQFAEDRNIPREDRMHRFYRRLHTVFCVHGTTLWRVSLLVMLVAATCIVGNVILSPP